MDSLDVSKIYEKLSVSTGKQEQGRDRTPCER